MAPEKGDSVSKLFEKGSFKYIPYSDELASVTKCGMPRILDPKKEFASGTVVVVAVPGAFTPTCSANHLPGYQEKIKELKAKGVDKVVFLAYNDPFVMSAWGKTNGFKDNYFIFVTDEGAEFSKSIGWNTEERTGRYAILLKDGKVIYAAIEDQPNDLKKSSVDVVLEKL